jgi:hypothetical protein
MNKGKLLIPVFVVVAAITLGGCKSAFEVLRPFLQEKSVSAALLAYTSFADSSNSLASSALLAAAAPAAEKRLALKAIADQQESFFTFPNKSFGKFKGQVSVAYNSLVGLADGQSLAFLEFRQPTAKPTPRRLYIAAVYDQVNQGLRAIVSDPDGLSFGTPISFPNTTELDLRIEQTATDLIFSARATPADQSAGGWMPVFTSNTAVDPGFFHLYVGIRHMNKRGVFFFNNFALQGDNIGGTTEYSIILDLRTSIEAIRRAVDRINAGTPADLTNARNDLDAAIAATNSGLMLLEGRTFLLQSPDFGKLAEKTLQKVATSLPPAREGVATLEPAKARAQLSKLDKAVLDELSATANLLGWSVSSLKPAPHLFSLRVP